MLLLLVCGTHTLLRAQPSAGTIRLEIRDPSGAAVVASGTLENLDTGATLSFSTDAEGAYRFNNLPFGRYRLSISKEGLETTSTVLTVRSASPVTRTLTMAIAGVENQVQVVAATPLGGTGQSPDEIAGAVQTATAADIRLSGSRRAWVELRIKLKDSQ
jgi:hypothetical protein